MVDPAEGFSTRWKRGLRQAIVLGLIMVTSLGCYLAILWTRGRDATIVTRTAWDEPISLQVGWVWVYLIPYLVGPVIAALLSRETFAWYIRRGLIVVGVSLLIFLLLPTKTVRPDEELLRTKLGTDLTSELYRNMITIDGPAANAAPSLHVSLTCLLAFALIRDFPRGWPIWLAGAISVWLATLFTWQHHLIDVATGVLLATLVALPWSRLPGFHSSRA